MATYTLDVPAAKGDLDAGRIEEFLVGKGIRVNWVSTAQRDSTIRLTIDADDNPVPVLATYARPVTRVDRARSTIKTMLPKLTANTATSTEVQETLAAVIVLMRDWE